MCVCVFLFFFCNLWLWSKLLLLAFPCGGFRVRWSRFDAITDTGRQVNAANEFKNQNQLLSFSPAFPFILILYSQARIRIHFYQS